MHDLRAKTNTKTPLVGLYNAYKTIWIINLAKSACEVWSSIFVNNSKLTLCIRNAL